MKFFKVIVVLLSLVSLSCRFNTAEDHEVFLAVANEIEKSQKEIFEPSYRFVALEGLGMRKDVFLEIQLARNGLDSNLISLDEMEERIWKKVSPFLDGKKLSVEFRFEPR